MRKTYLDNIRWITVVIVVFYHVIYMYNGIQTAGVIGPFREIQYQDAFQYMVYPWFMVLLFVISGMSARFYLNNHSEKEFIKTRTTKLLVPSTLGNIFFWWTLGYYNMAIAGAFESMGQAPAPVTVVIMMLSGTGPLWFIQMLWLFSVILVWFRKVEKDIFYKICEKTTAPILVVLTVIIYLSAQILNTPVVTVYRFGIYFAAFLIGYLCLSHDEVMERLEKWYIPLTISAIVLCAVFIYLYFGKPYAEALVLTTPLCNIYAWIATLAILSFMKKFGNFESSFSKWMTKKSWGLYLFHYLPIAMTAYYLNIYAKNLPAVLVYLLTTIAAFGGGFLLYEIISRIPFFKWCVCGIGGKKK